MVEADLMLLLDEGHAVRLTCSGDLYIVEVDSIIVYDATLTGAIGKAIDATEKRKLHSV